MIFFFLSYYKSVVMLLQSLCNSSKRCKKHRKRCKSIIKGAQKSHQHVNYADGL